MRFTNRVTFTKASLNLIRRPNPGLRKADSCKQADQAANGQPRLRDRWPFLNKQDVPVELQALVTRKITRYHEYTSLYAKLRDCQSVEECGRVAGKLLDAYLDNQAITREMDYYQKHGKVLGRHPLFRHFQQLARLRSSSVKELLKEQKKTRDNIWRVKSEIRKGDKPHLDEKRRQKLQEYEMRLKEINNLLGE